MRIPKFLRVTLRLVLWGGLALALLLLGGIAGGLFVRDQVQAYNASVDRIISPNGIDEARYVTLGGVRQWIRVRGMDRRQPILLYLHGGPGGAISDSSYAFQKPWEDYFTVVQWDQRGFGRSAIDLDKMQPVTKDQLVADAIELIELLKRQYNQPKIVLAAQSFGTILGASVAHERPDLLYAYVGLAQVAGWKRIFVESRDTMMANARQSGDTALLRELEPLGPPPSSDAKSFWEWAGKIQEPAVARGHFWYNAPGGLDLARRFMAWQMLSPTVSLGDLRRTMAGSADPDKTFYSVVGSILDWDFRKDLGLDFQVPMIFISGAHDLTTPVESVKLLESEIHAPYKSMQVLDHSAHVLMAEEPGRVLEALVHEALPFALGKTP